MTAVDTSVVVAAFASWHEGHRKASEALGRSPRLPAHVAVEAYSVLTRLPPPHRVAADIAHRFLTSRFPGPPLTLSGRGCGRLLASAVRQEITGGSIYDALVAATALEHRATLLTRDRRANRVYEAMGVGFELIE